MRIIALAFLFSVTLGFAQFDPAGGEAGSRSVHKDANSIVAWASGAVLQLGYLQVNDTALGKPTVGDVSSALGPFNGDIVSLGDGGVITLSFDNPILNNEGFDFAVFENGFKVGLSYYLELAHVEVSEDGVNFIRFPSESLTDTGFQTDNFGYIESEKIYNLAGKHQAPYGTLFDLQEVGLNQINYVRLIDVIGSVNDSFGTRDSKGRLINDPFPSPFPSCGFDLDAVAVVNGTLLKREELTLNQVKIYPSLAYCNESIKIENLEGFTAYVYNEQGDLINETQSSEVSFAQAGLYLIQVKVGQKTFTQKVVVR